MRVPRGSRIRDDTARDAMRRNCWLACWPFARPKTSPTSDSVFGWCSSLHGPKHLTLVRCCEFGPVDHRLSDPGSRAVADRRQLAGTARRQARRPRRHSGRLSLAQLLSDASAISTLDNYESRRRASSSQNQGRPAADTRHTGGMRPSIRQDGSDSSQNADRGHHLSPSIISECSSDVTTP
jgi:hypothetical protein